MIRLSQMPYWVKLIPTPKVEFPVTEVRVSAMTERELKEKTRFYLKQGFEPVGGTRYNTIVG